MRNHHKLTAANPKERYEAEDARIAFRMSGSVARGDG
jgi:hypothetical protein